MKYRNQASQFEQLSGSSVRSTIGGSKREVCYIKCIEELHERGFIKMAEPIRHVIEENPNLLLM